MTDKTEHLDLPEHRETLVLLAASPTIWVLHFLFCYVLVAIYCARLTTSGLSFQGIQIAVTAMTILSLSLIGVVTYFGYLRQQKGDTRPPHDDDSPLDRHRFLGYATLLLSGLSALATLFVSVVFMFFGDCRS